MKKVLIIGTGFLLPLISHASVLISEIAWMGDDKSANHEWMELKNDGSTSLAINGWTLEAEDGQPKIILAGTVSAGSFFLLERTNDESAPGVTADQIYTGALGNTGETLVLKDAGGVEIDKIVGGENWQTIGGDNATKQTAQRTSSGGWITATGTPKAPNVSFGSAPNRNSDSSLSSLDKTSGQANSSVSSADNSPKPELPEPKIIAKAGEDKTLIGGADAIFSGLGYGYKKEPLENAVYVWNFGDGGIAKGQKVAHAYIYPGFYIASLNLSAGKDSASDYINITVLPNELKISAVNSDFVKIKNGLGSRLDISNWILEHAGERFYFPEGTMIKEKTEVIIPNSISGLLTESDAKVSLLYPNGKAADSFSPQILSDNFIVAGKPVRPITIMRKKENVGIEIKPVLPDKTIDKGSDSLLSQTESLPVPKENLTAQTISGSGSGSKFWIILALISGTIAGAGAIISRKLL